MDETELHRLFNAIHTIPSVRRKADWCLKWFDRESYSLGTRLIAFAIVEGVFFSSSFAAIFGVRSRGLLPGLCHSNELIMRDEGQHMEFACKLYRVLVEKVPVSVVHEMIKDAVALEQAFFVCELYFTYFVGIVLYLLSCVTDCASGAQCDADESVRRVCRRLPTLASRISCSVRADESCTCSPLERLPVY